MGKYWYLCSLLLLAACIDQADYNVKSVTGSPAVIVPLLSGELSMQDALKQTDSAFVHVDGDGLLYLEYTKLLISSGLQKQIKIPDVSTEHLFHLPTFIPAHAQDIRLDSTNIVVDLNLNPELLTFVDFKAGSFIPSLSNTLLNYNVVFSSSDLINTTTGAPFEMIFSQTNDGPVSLADYSVQLNENKFNLKIVLIVKGPAGPVNLPAGSTITPRAEMRNMDYRYIQGFFGHHTVSPPVARLLIAAFGESLGKAHASFVDPIVSLMVYNNYSVPTEVSFTEFRAHKQGADLLGIVSPANPIPINFPPTAGTTATTTVNVSNGKQLIDFGPTEFLYSIFAEINRGLVTGKNSWYDTSTIKVGLHVKIPFYGHVSNVTMSDTAAIDLGDFKTSTVDSASLELTFNNQLPLDAQLQCYVADADHVILDSLLSVGQQPLIKSATVGSDGLVVRATASTQSIRLNTEAVNKLFSAKYIIVKATLNTSEGAVDVKFKSQYTLQLNVGLKAQLKTEITF